MKQYIALEFVRAGLLDDAKGMVASILPVLPSAAYQVYRDVLHEIEETGDVRFYETLEWLFDIFVIDEEPYDEGDEPIKTYRHSAMQDALREGKLITARRIFKDDYAPRAKTAPRANVQALRARVLAQAAELMRL